MFSSKVHYLKGWQQNLKHVFMATKSSMLKAIKNISHAFRAFVLNKNLIRITGTNTN